MDWTNVIWPLAGISLLGVAAAVLLHKKKDSAKTEAPDTLIPAAAAQSSLKTELHKRMEEFLEQDRFSLVIQPAVDFRTNRVAAGEVLARLNHPERGVIFPDEFLPIVDALDLYPKFDRYIFRKSCAWLSRSLAEGEQLECLSCNFSRKTLSQAGIAQELIQLADSYGVAHSKLALEITERERETDAQQLTENLNSLKAAGFLIVLDDFGNGVTSVNDLMQYPLDVVKIDRSLLLNAGTEQGDKAYQGLVDMAIKIGAEVVCEGIETEEQNRFAQACGCHYGQGFLFFKPTSPNEVFETMRKGSILDDTV